jgi:hypothetical protein
MRYPGGGLADYAGRVLTVVDQPDEDQNGRRDAEKPGKDIGHRVHLLLPRSIASEWPSAGLHGIALTPCKRFSIFKLPLSSG